MSSRRKEYRRLAVYSGIVFMIPTTFIGCFLLGFAADEYFETRPWLTLIGIFLGIAGVFVQLFHIVSRYR